MKMINKSCRVMMTVMFLCSTVTVIAQGGKGYKETTITPEINNVDTLNVYSGMTVSGEKKVVSEESLQVDNTTVTTGGKLKATANDAITYWTEIDANTRAQEYFRRVLGNDEWNISPRYPVN